MGKTVSQMGKKHLTIKDWMRVFWSDECAVKKDSDSSVVWVFRHQDNREKYDPKNFRGKSKGGGTQMIWACFSGTKLGPIVFVEGAINSAVYTGLNIYGPT